MATIRSPLRTVPKCDPLPIKEHYIYTQPGECPVVLEVSTVGDLSSAVLPVQGIHPDVHSKPQSYSAGALCFW